MATVKQFEDLEIWKLSRVLCNDINKIVEPVFKTEKGNFY